jgi:hypothetical protein
MSQERSLWGWLSELLDQPAGKRTCGRSRGCSLRIWFEPLERRTLLHAGAFDQDLGLHGGSHGEVLSGEDAVGHDHVDSPGAELRNRDGIERSPREATATSGQLAASAGKSPLSSVPQLHSLLGATASIYLDFNGHFEAVWGGFKNITTPVFDQDGDRTAFSAAELATITEVWQRVSEDFAPFRIDVTTVDPGNFANGRGLRVAIGGDSKWLGSSAGGVAYVDSFTNSIVNTVYAFSDNLGRGYGKYVAEAASHESGHAFGLQHQSTYSRTRKTAEYNPGTSALAPIMGNSYSAQRSTWWYGQTTSSRTYQDDMAVISRGANGFGYRADDFANQIAGAAALSRNGSQVSASGLIGTNGDRDYFRFATGGGTVNLTVNVADVGPNLDAKLELFNANGTLLASATPTNVLSATINRSVAAGAYYLAVSGDRGYGSVGWYTISGTAPTNTTVAQSQGVYTATGPFRPLTSTGNWAPITPNVTMGRTDGIGLNMFAGIEYQEAGVTVEWAAGSFAAPSAPLPIAWPQIAGSVVTPPPTAAQTTIHALPAPPFPGSVVIHDAEASGLSSPAASRSMNLPVGRRGGVISLGDSDGRCSASIEALFSRIDPAQFADRFLSP